MSGHHHLEATEPTLFIAHNGSDVVHWGEIDTGQYVSTGQPTLETFPEADRDQWETRLVMLGITMEEIYPSDDLPPDP